LLVLLSAYLLRGPLLRGFADWWVVDEPLQKAQAIVVLGGDNVMGDRVRRAVELYHAGWAPRVVLSGISFRSYFSETTFMEKEAVNLGVSREDLILFPHAGDSTIDEALALRRALAGRNFRKIIVVTSNYHTRRARRVFHAVYRRHGTQVVVSAAPDSEFNPGAWWRQRRSRTLMGLELLKSLHGWWELRKLPPPPQALVCIAARAAL
jgi:uncharacterized SAM-binding protein YcdF (DUF218 family)